MVTRVTQHNYEAHLFVIVLTNKQNGAWGNRGFHRYDTDNANFLRLFVQIINQLIFLIQLA